MDDSAGRYQAIIDRMAGYTGGSGLPPPLHPTGGEGHNDPMEPRVAKLESDMEHVKKALDRLVDVPVKLGVLEERMSHLPTKEYLVRSGLGLLAAIAALITFGEKLQHLVK